jgi:hypothetical protein
MKGIGNSFAIYNWHLMKTMLWMSSPIHSHLSFNQGGMKRIQLKLFQFAKNLLPYDAFKEKQ